MYIIPVWEMILEAVEANKLDNITNADIRKYIHDKYGNVNDGTINAQIGACCVNRQSRVQMPENQTPRMANGRYDFLFNISHGVYTKYNPSHHGQWAIVELGGQLAVKRIDQKQSDVFDVAIDISRPKRYRKTKRSNIERPSAQLVRVYLNKWETLENYIKQEDAVVKLFRELCPDNKKIEDILLKTTVLNTFYSTNVFNISALAQHIYDLNIDHRLKQGDLSLVADISIGHGIMYKNSGRERRFYSFATKYCSHHCPQIYPIYDSFVEDMLIYLRDTDEFHGFTREQLRDFRIFRNVIVAMQNYYELEEFSFKEIDKYLWQCGKEYFPRSY